MGFLADKTVFSPLTKEILEESDIKIGLGCDDCSIYFDIFVNGVKIYNNKFDNNCGIPDLNFLLDTDY